MALIEYKCRSCDKNVTRDIQWINPTQGVRNKLEMQSTFWCSNQLCKMASSVIVKFLPKQKIEVIEVMSIDGLYNGTGNNLVISRSKKTKA